MSRVSFATRWLLLRGILTERPLMVLFAVGGVWAACDAAIFLASSVVALDLAGVHGVGLVGAVRVLPGALCLGFVAVVGDRVSRSLLVVGSMAVLAAVSLALAAVASRGAGLAALSVLLAVASVASAFMKANLHGLLPRLTPLPSQLVQAGAAAVLAAGVGSVVGPVVAGGVVATRGAADLYVGLGVVLACGALLAVAMRTTYQSARDETLTRGLGRWRPLRGLGLFAPAGARTMLALTLVQHALLGLVGASVVLYAFDASAARGEQLSGGLLTALGAGGLVGSALSLAADSRHTRWWFAAGVVLYGLPLAALGLTSDTRLATASLVVSGAGGAWAVIYGSGLITRLLPDHVAGRGWGVVVSLGAVAAAAGSLAGPLLADLLGLSTGLLVSGLLAAGTVVLAVPGLRALAHRTVPPADVLGRLRDAPVLASLPGICLERLAVAAVRRPVHAGQTVVRQGETGLDFFVIDDGELSVSVDGQEVRRLVGGDSFGEVALLRAVPRTATVTALTPGRLLVLDRETFVTTVTGHRPSESWAEGAVADLLVEDERRQHRELPG